jgi:hypothetical protein
MKVAAYQSRSVFHYEEGKAPYDFTHKADLLYTQIFLPKQAPEKFKDRTILWHEADKAEKRYDARLGKTIIAALQNELDLVDYIRDVEEFVLAELVTHDLCVDVAIHGGHHEYDLMTKFDHQNVKADNPHTHILFSDRPVCSNGFCTNKNRELNQKKYLLKWREQWNILQNRSLKEKGFNVEISCESFEVQGIERKPQVHLSRQALEMEARGIKTDRGNKNRKLVTRNATHEKKREKKENKEMYYTKSR